MSTTTKKKVTKKKAVTRKRTVNRTAKEERPSEGQSRAEPMRPADWRPRSIGDYRDILGVIGKNSNFVYRFVLSKKDFSKRIYDALRAGWEFVDATKEKHLILGDHAVAKTDQHGSLYRIPAGNTTPDDYLYLMKMRKEDAEYVQALKERDIKRGEDAIFGHKDVEDGTEEGQYTVKTTLEDYEAFKPQR